MTRAAAVILVLASLTIGCGTGPGPETAGSIDLVEADRFFREFETLCTEDAGGLWGRSLCGPILLVDPATRDVVANRADPGRRLEPRGAVFVGRLPAEVGVANTTAEWSGARWTMLLTWSLGGDRVSRLRLMAHESFHRLQPELGLVAVGEINAHLDDPEGRFWLQMEWNALQKALLSNGEIRNEAIADALTFRAARRARFPEATSREIALEIFEGLAEYTGMRLAGFSDRQVIEAVTRKRNEETGFVRSFAYLSGPLYGYLLDGSGIDWRSRVRNGTDLGVLLGEARNASPARVDDAARRAAAYGGAALRAAEEKRERERKARRAEWRASLVEGPVLVVDLDRVTSGTFDPGDVHPFGEHRTVYGSRELIAEWGVLTVSGGAILEDESTGRGYVSLSGAEEDFSAGEGWTLELNDGWRVGPAERAGDSRVVRRRP